MLKRLSRALPVALALMGCSAPSEILDVSYDDRFGERTTMDIYLPAGEPTQSPAIVMIHGGAWRFGSKDAYRDAAVRMARSGWVAVTINYRLGSAGMYPRAVQDCVCAISFLRRNADDYGIDPNRVAVTGYSAGGHLASLVGLAADLPEHVPDCASGGTTLPNAIISAAGAQDLHGKDRAWVRDFLGGSENQVPQRYNKASPIFHVAPNKPPLLMTTGGADWFADFGDLNKMRDDMLDSGNDAQLLLINGGGHLINPDENVGAVDLEVADMTPEGWTAMSDFLDRTLGWP